MDRKHFRHPRVGPLSLDQHVLELPGSEGLRIWAYHPADDTTSRSLRRLLDTTPSARTDGRAGPEALRLA